MNIFTPITNLLPVASISMHAGIGVVGVVVSVVGVVITRRNAVP